MIVELGDGRRTGDARNRERDERRFAFPADRRVADLRFPVLEQPAGITVHLHQIDSGAGQSRFDCALGAGPQPNQALRDFGGHRLGRALALYETGARPVFIPGVLAAHDFDVRILLTVRQRAFDLRAAAGKLVRVADAVARCAELPRPGGCFIGGDGARLAVDLDRALTAILERDGELVLLDAAQHDHAPGPVVQHGLQVFGAFRGCVQLRRGPAELRVRRNREKSRETGCECDTRRGRFKCHRSFPLTGTNCVREYHRWPMLPKPRR